MAITIPHKFQPRNYQLNLLRALDNGIKRAVIVWHRRSGKDKVCFNYMIKKALQQKGTYFYFLPTYSQAKKVIWENIDNDGFNMLDHIPKELLTASNGTELKLSLVNGSVIQLIAADEFKNSGVGTNPLGVVFSEYSISSPDAWKFVSPILAANNGWAIFNFTPRGMNHAWTLLQQARNNDKWFSEILTADDTNSISKEALDEERKINPEDFIQQEYYCKFIDGASSFFRNVTENAVITDEKPIPTHRYRIGVDLAKHQDFTVITVFDLMTFTAIKQDRFNQLDYTLQKAKIEAMYHKYFKPLIYIDSTGVGEPIYDDLCKLGMNVQPFKFTEQTRKDLLMNLKLLFELNKIKIPADDTLISELKSFQYMLSENGKLKIQVPDGIHDDTVFSLALACWELPTNPIPAPGSLKFLIKYNEEHEQTSYE